MAKILKNTTGSGISLSILGLPDIPANNQVEIQTFDYLLLGSEDSVNYLTPLINSGAIIINDGFTDLTAVAGIKFIKFDLISKISDTDTGPSNLENKIVSGPGVVVTKQTDINGVQSLSLSSTGTFEGKGFQTTFAGNGTFRDSWLSQEDTNVESNESPDVFKYNARLVGVDFTNQNQNVDAIIIFAIKEYPFSNVNNPERFYKWTLNNVRSAVRTSDTKGFTVNAGDVMAVYLADNGNNANDLIVTMDFIILTAPETELQFSYSQNFSSSDFPAFNTIPEVLT